MPGYLGRKTKLDQARGFGTQPLTKMLREGDVRRYAGAVIDQENGINGRQEAWPALSIRNIEILEGDLKNGDMGRDTGCIGSGTRCEGDLRMANKI